MARMTSSAAEGSRSQFPVEFDRPVRGVGYSNMDGTGPSLSIGFDADDEKEVGKFGRKARMTGRNARLTFNQADLTRILDMLVNPNYTMGFIFDGESNNPSDRLKSRVLEDCGLVPEKYRAPHRSFHGRDGWLYIWALNPHHAHFQFKKLVKEQYDANAVEIEREGEWVKLQDFGRV